MADHYDVGEITVTDRVIHSIQYTDIDAIPVRTIPILTSHGQQQDLRELVLANAVDLQPDYPFLCARIVLNTGTTITLTLERAHS